MATIRRAGFGTVFELEDSKVGIGTDAATHTLQALGNIRSEGVQDVGISSLTTYQGFTDKEAGFTGQIDIESQSGATSDEIVIDGDVTVSSATTFTSGPQNLTVTDTFTLPSGDTNSREIKPTIGSLRFNQDFATLEFYTGNNWATVKTLIDIKTNPQGRGRGVFSGFCPDLQNGIQFVEIMTKGNALDFGTNETGTLCAGTSNGTRGVFSGGAPAPYKDRMEYITIASQGDAIDFGDLTQNRGYAGSGSSSTRGLVIGGFFNPTYTNIIDYHQISTLGDAIDFGDTRQTGTCYGAAGSQTRAVFNNGNLSAAFFDTVKYSTLGNSTGFGELTQKRRACSAAGNSVRGIYSGGYLGGNTHKNTIDYITFASEGNAIDFGDRTFTGSYSSSASNSVRVVSVGGFTPSYINNEEFITIATTGNAQDFGDSAVGSAAGSVSDSHGGLGGY